MAPDDSSYDPTVHLSHGDVKVNDRDSPEFLTIHIKASKTDLFRRGGGGGGGWWVTVYIGRVTEELCPVAAILNYMVRRGSSFGLFFKLMMADSSRGNGL